ncbi:ATP-binding protein [Streptomyces sp. NL15-2K]|uniref:ATP-binding protein n=1 Tax=Streptomyces sp. NL15-2K TaxID=376149 RepID=UPI000F58D561|nr:MULTISPECIES: ATP-binding protein [Actinomycetes]WKX12543.1 ATP-binding protein [Kutzneria buriramensis]
MKSEISTPQSAPAAPAAAQSTRRFTQLLSSTPRGARLARLLAVQQLAQWGWPETCSVSESAAMVVAELATNAVTHGRVAGRGFRLALVVESPDTLRIEVTDLRGDRRPLPRTTPSTEEEAGRGLLIVGSLATRWGSEAWPPAGKTVWAEIRLSGRAASG